MCEDELLYSNWIHFGTFTGMSLNDTTELRLYVKGLWIGVIPKMDPISYTSLKISCFVTAAVVVMLCSSVEGLEISKSKNAFGKWECSMIPLISWDKIKWEKSSFNTKCFTDRIRTNTNSVIFFEDKWWHLLLLYLFSRRLNCF